MKRASVLILALLMVVSVVCMSILPVSAAICVPDPYYDVVVNYICDEFDAVPEDVLCCRTYHHPSDYDDLEMIPDFIVYYTELNYKYETVKTYGIYGDDYINNVSYGAEGDLGHLVYFPETDEIITLREAWDNNIEGVRECVDGTGVMIGDNDYDGKITVKDATIVQKCLAGIRDAEYFKVYAVCEQGSDAISHFCDFNRDGELNVRDVTAIQKFAAGITE